MVFIAIHKELNTGQLEHTRNFKTPARGAEERR